MLAGLVPTQASYDNVVAKSKQPFDRNYDYWNKSPGASALNFMGTIGSKLPANLKRAVKQGYDITTPYYHATTKDFPAFDPKKNLSGGKGVTSLTKDVNFANKLRVEASNS